jgi:DNA-binding NarL/FixJ family response regulator
VSIKVLAVEEDERLRAWLGHHVTALWPRSKIEYLAPTELAGQMTAFRPGRFHLLLLSLDLDQINPFRNLMDLCRRQHCPPVIVLAKGGHELHAVNALKLGAVDYLPKRMLSGELLVDALRGAHAEHQRRLDEERWRGRRTPELEGYVIIRPLARTRYSSVYLALSAMRDEEVAIKILERAGDGSDNEAAARFEREYRLAKEIASDRIARIYEYGVRNEYAYIALEYFPRGDLRKRLERPMLPRHAVRFLRQMAEALKEIHSAGVVHGDLKPGNVMLRSEDDVALIDFGLARRTQGSTVFEEFVEGTPYYLSPERADGEEPDVPGDLYSLGAMFFEMLTGSPPYLGGSAMEVVAAHQLAPVPRLGRGLRRFQPLVDALLAKDPAQRHPDAAALIADLEHYDAYADVVEA